MASVPHGCARATPRVQAEFQAAQTPCRVVTAQYGLNPKTVLKWRRRAATVAAAKDPRKPTGTYARARRAMARIGP